MRTILIAIAAIIVTFIVVVALQPSEFRVERTAVITAAPSTVFAQVNDFHKWEAWSPWAKLDPAAKTSFEGPSSGTGAVFTWSGNDEVGEGRMTMVESTPGERVKIKVDFVRPFEGTSNSEFDLTPAGDQTAVTWIMSGHHDFIAKAMCLIINGNEMIGSEMDKGLAKMKSVIESVEATARPS